MKYQILQGDNRTTLKTFPDDHFDSIVTDPPYGLSFLGKAWDANTGSLETYQECLRVLKPGGHILAFSAARTYHHLAVTIEQAGFEIRDQIMWIYSSGFPKSQDVGRQLHKKEHGKPDKQRYSKDEMTKEGDNYRHNTNKKLYKILPDINGDRLEKSHEGDGYGYIFEEIITIDNEWAGWGTQLKPAHEPIVLARKPMKSSIAANCQEHGVGALNIDAARVPYESEYDAKHQEDIRIGQENATNGTNFFGSGTSKVDDISLQGRFPSNVLGEIAEPYQKYFYWPKVSRAERHIGFDQLPDSEPLNSPEQVRNHPLWEPSIGTNAHRLKEKIRTEEAKLETHDINVMGKTPMCLDCNKTFNGTNNHGACDPSKKAFVEKRKPTIVGNNHPTVKPIELMKYLIRLITPAGGHVLDPFNGSGSTGCAAVELDFAYTGIELDPKYIDISERRIESWYRHTHPNNFGDLFEVLD